MKWVLCLAVLLVALSIPSSGYGQSLPNPGPCAQPQTTGWCLVWPVNGVSFIKTGLFRGWTWMMWDSNNSLLWIHGGSVCNSSGTLAGIGSTDTFSDVIWGTAYQSQVPSSTPWMQESASGDSGSGCNPNNLPTHSDPVSSSMGADLLSTDTTINVNSRCSSIWPATNFINGEVPNVWVDDENIQYSAVNCTGATGTLTIAARGIRGTTVPATHTHTGNPQIFGGSPKPFGGAFSNGGYPNGVIKAITTHIPFQHPWRQMCIDTTSAGGGHTRIWWTMGANELGRYGHTAGTWFYDINAGTFTEVPSTLTPFIGTNDDNGRSDGAMACDTNDQVLVLYGGSLSGGSTDETFVMCLNPNDTSTQLDNKGCSSTLGTFSPTHPRLYVWNKLTASSPKPLTCSGNQWVQNNPCASGSTNPGPGIRHTHGVVFDVADDKILMFGGQTDDHGGSYCSTTFPGSSGSCCNGPTNPNGPAPYTWAYSTCPDEPNDLWMYDVLSRKWTQLIYTVGSQTPAPGARPAIAWDSHLNLLVYNLGPGAGKNPNSVGVYEQGLYTATINAGAGQATWTLTNVGTGTSPSPDFSAPPYSQNAGPDSTGATCHNTIVNANGQPLFDRCDHAVESLIFDSTDNVGGFFPLIYIDKYPNDQSSSQATQMWITLDKSFGTAPPPPPSVNTLAQGKTLRH